MNPVNSNQIDQNGERKNTPLYIQEDCLLNASGTLAAFPDEVLALILNKLRENTPFVTQQDHTLFKVCKRFNFIHQENCQRTIVQLVKKGILSTSYFKNNFSQLKKVLQPTENSFWPHPHVYLRELNLQSASLSFKEMNSLFAKKAEKELPSFFATPQLKKLSFNFDAVKENALQLRESLVFLTAQPQLESLTIDCPVVDLRALSYIFDHLPNLKKVSLKLQEEIYLADLIEALSKLKNLNKLTLQNIEIDESEIILSKKGCQLLNQLETLNLDSFASDFPEAILELCEPLLQYLTHLRAFSWKSANYENFNSWLAHFSKANQLKSLHLESHILFKEEIDELKNTHSLIKLSLKENIKESIVETQEKSKCSDPLIEDKDLTTFLIKKSFLEELSLELIAITGKGIAKALQNCHQLKKLSIRNCLKMTKENLIAILEASPIEELLIEREDYERAYLCGAKEFQGKLNYSLHKTFKDQKERAAFIAHLKKEETPSLLFDSNFKFFKQLENDNIEANLRMIIHQSSIEKELEEGFSEKLWEEMSEEMFFASFETDLNALRQIDKDFQAIQAFTETALESDDIEWNLSQIIQLSSPLSSPLSSLHL